jgi:hypothetical protein
VLSSAAKRRKNAAHGASRGFEVEKEQAPTGRKTGYDTRTSLRTVSDQSSILKRESISAPTYRMTSETSDPHSHRDEVPQRKHPKILQQFAITHHNLANHQCDRKSQKDRHAK